MLIARNQVYAQCNLVKVLSEFGFLFVGSMTLLHQYDFRKDITPLCTHFKVSIFSKLKAVDSQTMYFLFNLIYHNIFCLFLPETQVSANYALLLNSACQRLSLSRCQKIRRLISTAQKKYAEEFNPSNFFIIFPF